MIQAPAARSRDGVTLGGQEGGVINRNDRVVAQADGCEEELINSPRDLHLLVVSRRGSGHSVVTPVSTTHALSAECVRDGQLRTKWD